MSRWLQLALQETVPFAPIAPERPGSALSVLNGTSGTLPAVPPAEVRAMFDWLQNRLAADHNLSGETGREAAMRSVRASIRNDPRLAPTQDNPRLCLICGGAGSQGRPLVPALSAVQGLYHWLHAGDCHRDHQARQGVKVAACMAAAGLQAA